MAPHVEEPVWEKIKELDKPIIKTRPQTKYKFTQITLVVLLHLFTLYTLIVKIQHMKIWTIIYAIVLVILAVLGTTAGAHRLWSHRSYKATWPLRLFLFCCFALCSHFYNYITAMYISKHIKPDDVTEELLRQKKVSIYNWVQLHRIHHKYPDTEADPHNSSRGFFFAHIGWFLVEKTPECREKKKEVDMSDILKELLARFHSRFFTEISFILLFLPSIVPVFLWGEDPFLSFLASGVLRSAGALHCVVSINSVAHLYGIRPYNKRIQPRETALVSFLALGEGWHNYHHTFPWDYKAGEFGDRLNLTARFLDLCAILGLAYDLKTASPHMVSRMKEKNGDGSHIYQYN